MKITQDVREYAAQKEIDEQAAIVRWTKMTETKSQTVRTNSDFP